MLPFIGNTKHLGDQTSHFGYIFGAKFGHNNEWYVPDSLKTVVITSATNIGESAFSDCTNLTSITIPDSVKSLGLHAFSRCSSLTNITIPDGVTSLTSSVFYGCSSLTNITIPNTVTFIAENTFEGCTTLTNIRFEGTVSEWKHIYFEHMYLDRAWNTDVPAAVVICSDGVVKLK